MSGPQHGARCTDYCCSMQIIAAAGSLAHTRPTNSTNSPSMPRAGQMHCPMKKGKASEGSSAFLASPTKSPRQTYSGDPWSVPGEAVWFSALNSSLDYTFDDQYYIGTARTATPLGTGDPLSIFSCRHKMRVRPSRMNDGLLQASSNVGMV